MLYMLVKAGLQCDKYIFLFGLLCQAAFCCCRERGFAHFYLTINLWSFIKLILSTYSPILSQPISKRSIAGFVTKSFPNNGGYSQFHQGAKEVREYRLE